MAITLMTCRMNFGVARLTDELRCVLKIISLLFPNGSFSYTVNFYIQSVTLRFWLSAVVKMQSGKSEKTNVIVQKRVNKVLESLVRMYDQKWKNATDDIWRIVDVLT